MSDHDTLSPEADDALRARLRAFAEEIQERTDTEAALERMPHRSRPPTIQLLAIAACLLVAVLIAAVLMEERQSVDTAPSNSPPLTTECPNPTQPRAITSGGQMKTRFAAPVASAATALMLLGACDGPTTVAKGEDVELVGGTNLGGQTLNISAEEQDGKVTGEFRVTDDVITIQCADTSTDGVVILGGEVTTSENFEGLLALIIREGDPDSVSLYANDIGAASCTELLDSIPADSLTDDSNFIDVLAGSDIKTG